MVRVLYPLNPGGYTDLYCLYINWIGRTDPPYDATKTYSFEWTNMTENTYLVATVRYNGDSQSSYWYSYKHDLNAVYVHAWNNCQLKEKPMNAINLCKVGFVALHESKKSFPNLWSSTLAKQGTKCGPDYTIELLKAQNFQGPKVGPCQLTLHSVCLSWVTLLGSLNSWTPAKVNPVSSKMGLLQKILHCILLCHQKYHPLKVCVNFVTLDSRHFQTMTWVKF